MFTTEATEVIELEKNEKPPNSMRNLEPNFALDFSNSVHSVPPW